MWETDTSYSFRSNEREDGDNENVPCGQGFKVYTTLLSHLCSQQPCRIKGVRTAIQLHPRRTCAVCERSYKVAGQVWREVFCLLPSVLPSCYVTQGGPLNCLEITYI